MRRAPCRADGGERAVGIADRRRRKRMGTSPRRTARGRPRPGRAKPCRVASSERCGCETRHGLSDHRLGARLDLDLVQRLTVVVPVATIRSRQLPDGVAVRSAEDASAAAPSVRWSRWIAGDSGPGRQRRGAERIHRSTHACYKRRIYRVSGPTSRTRSRDPRSAWYAHCRWDPCRLRVKAMQARGFIHRHSPTSQRPSPWAGSLLSGDRVQDCNARRNETYAATIRRTGGRGCPLITPVPVKGIPRRSGGRNRERRKQGLRDRVRRRSLPSPPYGSVPERHGETAFV